MSSLLKNVGRLSTRTSLFTPRASISSSDALNQFKDIVKQHVPRASAQANRPVVEVVGKLTQFNRTVTVMNRRKRNGIERETVVSVLNGKRPVLILSRPELDALEAALPKIKVHFKEYAKLI